MRTCVGLIVTIIMFLHTPLLSFAEGNRDVSDDQVAEDSIGPILEHASDYSFIQVGDRNYKVDKVNILETEGAPQPASRADFREDDIVGIIPGGKSDDLFWIAEKVNIYRGDLRQEMMEELQLHNVTQKSLTDNTEKASSKPAPSRENKIIFENGVWHN